MMEKLPYNELKFIEPPECSNLKVMLEQSAAGQSDKGYILEVDLEYPNELHDSHNDYPLAPEKLQITPEMLSSYNEFEVENDDGPFTKEIMNETSKRLVTVLSDKERYVIHYKNLLYYVSKGLSVKKVHRVIEFTEKAWMQKYIQLNTERRTKATSDFEKDFYKLMNNSVYGKTMENVWSYMNVHLVTDEKIARKLIMKPWFTYRTFKIFTPDLVAVHMPYSTVKLNKPIYTGFAVLELSKLHKC
jgi:DNA polymerase type B, organellar and viral